MSDPFAPLKAAGPSIVVDGTLFKTPAQPLSLNTSGWEDSLSADWEGGGVSFTYFRADPFYFQLYKELRLGPARIGWPQIRNNPGVSQQQLDMTAEIYQCDEYSMVSNIGAPINLPLGAEGCQQIVPGGKEIFFSRSLGTGRGLYYSRKNKFGKWLTPTPLPWPLFDADNPFYVAATKTLYYEAVNPQTSRLSLYQCTRTGDNTYENFQLLPPSINAPGTANMQPWVSPDGKGMLFSRDHFLLMSADLTRPTASPRPLVMINASPSAGAIGEPTMNSRGELFFIYVFVAQDPVSGRTMFDADCFKLQPNFLRFYPWLSASVAQGDASLAPEMISHINTQASVNSVAMLPRLV